MKGLKNYNIVLLAIIVALIIAIISFNYGYSLGERRGYVLGVERCLEEVGNKDGQQKNQL